MNLSVLCTVGLKKVKKTIVTFLQNETVYLHLDVYEESNKTKIDRIALHCSWQIAEHYEQVVGTDVSEAQFMKIY